MFVIIGILAVFGAILGGFLMEKGQLLVLMQPSELLIIGGAALGILLASNPLFVLKKICGGSSECTAGHKFLREAIHRVTQDDVQSVQQGSQGRTGGN